MPSKSMASKSCASISTTFKTADHDDPDPPDLFLLAMTADEAPADEEPSLLLCLLDDEAVCK